MGSDLVGRMWQRHEKLLNGDWMRLVTGKDVSPSQGMATKGTRPVSGLQGDLDRKEQTEI